jgi:hypothetical protein
MQGTACMPEDTVYGTNAPCRNVKPYARSSLLCLEPLCLGRLSFRMTALELAHRPHESNQHSSSMQCRRPACQSSRKRHEANVTYQKNPLTRFVRWMVCDCLLSNAISGLYPIAILHVRSFKARRRPSLENPCTSSPSRCAAVVDSCFRIS